MILAVRIHGDPVLRQVARRIEVFDDALRCLAQDMFETMYAKRGIGLAAQQIGETVRLCVVDLQDCVSADEKCTLDGKSIPVRLLGPIALINSRIGDISDEETEAEEGCLSFPGISGEVWRPEKITAFFQDLSGVAHVLECSGLMARCIQHENDHLDGIVFVQRMEKNIRKALRDKLKELEGGNETITPSHP